jgi:murein DD-endopeptidase MepM/ murein hydrolase activator NlpD
VDHRPSDLDPYPRLGRDLAALELWDQSLERSRQRRRLERASRSHRQRRKGTSLAVGAAMLAAPVMPAFAGSGRKSGSGGAGSAEKALDTSSLAAATGGRTQLLRFGDIGPAVAAIQRQLGVASDGIFGPITRGAVERFQREHALAVTGVVDARTWAALFNGRVLFYDASGAPDGAKARAAGTAAVRLVVDRDDDGDGAQTGSPEGTGSVPSSDESESGSGPAAGEDSGPAGGGPSGDEQPETRPAPAPTEDPEPEPAPAPPTSAGGCTDGSVSAPAQGTVTGRFGDGRGDHAHAGLDIAAASGTPIHAVQCGTVSQSGSEAGYGLMVCVRHAGGVTTCYAHMSRTQASVNEQVQAGQVIGYVGCTGSCTGPHVHFEVRRNGAPEDPAPYLAGQRTIAGTTGSTSASDATAVSTRRTATTSAGETSGSTTQTAVGRAAVITGTQPARQAAPESAPTATEQAALAAQPAAEQAPAEQTAPAPYPAAGQAAPEQAAPAPDPAAAQAAPEQAAAAPDPAAEQAAPEPQPAAEQAPTEQAAPEQATPSQQPAAEQPPPEAQPAAEQPAPEAQPAAEQPPPAAEQPPPATEQPAPEPPPATEQPAPEAQPAADTSVAPTADASAAPVAAPAGLGTA